MLDQHIIDKINTAHDNVVSHSKDAIQEAIIAGGELTRIKEMCEHGEFIAIINDKFNFNPTTVFKYMRVYRYANSLKGIPDLQSAYRLIESEETKKKQAESVEQRDRLAYRTQHNEKPSTWQRADDYAWQKLQAERKERDERIAKAKADIDNQSKANHQRSEQAKADSERIKQFFNSQSKKQEQLEHLGISNQNGNILELIDSYIVSLDNDDQRIEECHNIIKYCKNKAASLQVSGQPVVQRTSTDTNQVERIESDE